MRKINDWLPLECAPTGNRAHNLGTCPDWESNWQPFASLTKGMMPNQWATLVRDMVTIFVSATAKERKRNFHALISNLSVSTGMHCIITQFSRGPHCFAGALWETTL